MTSLEDVKNAFLSGKFKLAYELARQIEKSATDHMGAIISHRMALSADALGWTEQAGELYEASEKKFALLAAQGQPEWLGHAITRRDHMLFLLKSCRLARGADRKAVEQKCLAGLEEAEKWLNDLEFNPRVELERRFTQTYKTRANLLIKPYDKKALKQLELDWRDISELRGFTKAHYELELLERLLNTSFTNSPVVYNGRVRRAIVLSVQIGNPNKLAYYGAKPVINLGYRIGSKLMARLG